jgi:hypothetical protein
MTNREERLYAIDVILRRHLGLDIVVLSEDRIDTSVEIVGAPGYLLLPDGFFKTTDVGSLRAPIPEGVAGRFVAPGESWAGGDRFDGVPVVFDARAGTEEWFARWGDRAVLNTDPLGTCFFLLSGYEEAMSDDGDVHDRYPAERSLAWRAGFLLRPIVDEHAEILWWAMQTVWPALARRNACFMITPTHDVDLPFQHAFTGFGRMLLSCGADVIRRRRLLQPFKRVSQWCRTKAGDPTADPANTFDLIMDMSERAGRSSLFNFIVDHPAPKFDAYYDISHPWIRALMRRVVDRGHAIGLHLSYGSSDSTEQMRKEVGIFRRLCEDLSVPSTPVVSRQHWLRFRMPETMSRLDEAGVGIDMSVTFERSIGFRSGTCRPYPLFDVRRRHTLRLMERPTIVMDASITDSGTMGLGNGEAAASAALAVKRRCEAVRGDFIVLWHNSRLTTPADVELYRNVLEC